MKNILLTAILLFNALFTFSQEELTILDLFSKLPEEAFDATAEGLSSSETEELIYTGKTDFWELAKKTKTEFKISGGDQSISLKKINTSLYEMVAVNTQYAQTSTVEIWAYNADEDYLIKKDILPKVSVTDFYSKEDALKIPKEYKGSISLYLDEGKIVASLWTWMESTLENIEIKYAVYLDWADDKFVINRQLK